MDEIAKIRIDILEAEEEYSSRSRGRQTDLETADNGSDVRVAKPGEFRLLTNKERISGVFPAKDKRESQLDLGKMVAIAAGESPFDCAEERTALTGSQDSLGGFSVPLGISNTIADLMRNKSRCIEAGALTYQMRTRKELLPKLTTDPTGHWKAEGAENTEDSTTAIGAIELQSRTLMFWLPISKELWGDAKGLGDFLMKTIAACAASKLDYAGLMGEGVDNEPQGLYYNSDVTQTAALTTTCYDDMSDQIYRIQDANHEPTVCLLSPRSLNLVRKLKDGDSRYMPLPDWCPPIRATKQIPDTLGAGAESISIMGDFTNMIIGMREQFTIEVLKEIKSQNYQNVLFQRKLQNRKCYE